MSKELKVISDFNPAGDQPKAIKELVEGINSGLLNQTLLGVTGSGKTFAMAKVIEELQRPAIVMAHNKTLAAQLYGEFKEFLPNNAVEYFVSYYDYYQPEAYVPTTDIYIEKDASINEHINQMRLSATKAVMERRDVVIVASVSAIYGLGDPRRYFKMVIHLDRGEQINQRTFIRRLAELQYERNEADFRRSVYRVRGDVIDVFPADSEKEALRIEIFGEEIESLKFFDPLTGEESWKLPEWDSWALLVSVGCFGAIGQLLILWAYAKSKATTLAPISYCHIIWAVIFGYLIFNSLPDSRSIIGAALIVSAGMYAYKKIEKNRTIDN